MKKILEKNKGITLVALVVTIIILLILAGITINQITGQNGIIARAQQGETEYVKAQLKEEIELVIFNIKAEEIIKGNNVTLETLTNQLPTKMDIIAEYSGSDITGEYKDYDYTIDENFNVEIGGKITGSKATGKAEILTTGYIFEGTVEIKVTTNIEGGTITEIVLPEGATLKTTISETEKLYEVSKNGKYVFKIVADSGRITNAIAEVNNILEVPQISVKQVLYNKFTIQVENNYPEGAITEYKYYIEDEIKNEGTTNTSYVVKWLMPNVEYTNIKVEAYIGENKKESNIVIATTAEGQSEVEKYREAGTYFTEKTALKDNNDNIIQIPAGFKIATDSGANVTEGIVIEDSDIIEGIGNNRGNQYVWIPVGTEINKNDGTVVDITLGRYTFTTNGKEILEQSASDYEDETVIGTYFKELVESRTGVISSKTNTTALNLKNFIDSVRINGGYYIARYEASYGLEDKKANSKVSSTFVNVDRVAPTKEGELWHSLTQIDAAKASRDLYETATTDLINSYSWDTAIVYIQKFSNDGDYSLQKTINKSLANTGVNSDELCKINDMASNLCEWSTETSNSDTRVGGGVFDTSASTSMRSARGSGVLGRGTGFRYILYM